MQHSLVVGIGMLLLAATSALAQPAPATMPAWVEPQATANLACMPRPDSPPSYSSARTGQCAAAVRCPAAQVYFSRTEQCVDFPPALVTSAQCAGFFSVVLPMVQQQLGDRKDAAAEAMRTLMMKDAMTHMLAVRDAMPQLRQPEIVQLSYVTGAKRAQNAAWADSMTAMCSTDGK